MTNQEAINALIEFWNWFCSAHFNSPYATARINYAFILAIDALKRCEDIDPFLTRRSEVEE